MNPADLELQCDLTCLITVDVPLISRLCLTLFTFIEPDTDVCSDFLA